MTVDLVASCGACSAEKPLEELVLLSDDEGPHEVRVCVDARACSARRRRQARARCDCGRFAAWDGYYGRWYCNGCDRAVRS
ncbi:MAG TPA: hypothetical protein VM204_09175 [Gaiellaceae bacterium]|nr:hypothetical protein [Gaiellaceae bacterium]